MSYEFDVFVSYRRHGEWPVWAHDIFRPLFYHWLGEELGRDPLIFLDTDIEAGDSWPNRLGNALGRTRVLVPLFSRQYFSSPWCRREFAQMRQRESLLNIRTPENPHGLIVPAHIHDGNGLPAMARDIQAAQLQRYTNVRLSKSSFTEERLSEEIRDWVPDIAKAINRAPACDPAWVTMAAEGFVEEFLAVTPQQLEVPRIG